jgi:hypothetical protein
MDGKSPGIHLIGGWVDSRAGLEALEKRKSLVATGNSTTMRRPTSSYARVRYSGFFHLNKGVSEIQSK